MGVVHAIERGRITVLAGRKGGLIAPEIVAPEAIVALRWPLPERMRGIPIEDARPLAAQPVALATTALTTTALQGLIQPLGLAMPEPEEEEEPLPLPRFLSTARPASPPKAAPPPKFDERADGERRAAAKGRVKDAVLNAARATLDEQMRYELALQAKNENVRAMGLLEREAHILKLTVAELAGRIIGDRRARERHMMQV